MCDKSDKKYNFLCRFKNRIDELVREVQRVCWRVSAGPCGRYIAGVVEVKFESLQNLEGVGISVPTEMFAFPLLVLAACSENDTLHLEPLTDIHGRRLKYILQRNACSSN